MKKVLMFLLVTCLLVLGQPVQATGTTSIEVERSTDNENIIDSGTCGENLTWTLDENGTLTISGTGAMQNYDWDTPWGEYSDFIKNTVITEGVTTIGDWAFTHCRRLTSITIPDSLTAIGDMGFYRCGLMNITIPDSVTSIGGGAFSESSLKSITIPVSVTSIGEYAFAGCSSLTGIWVDENNTAYSSDNVGVLFNKDKTTLIQVPMELQGHYTIPGSVTTIGKESFYFCYDLTSIVIPNSVTAIGFGAFEGCQDLESITIPASVTTIGDWAFADCYSLTNVFSGGTMEQWAAISIGTNNECLTNATIHFPEDPNSSITVNTRPAKTEYLLHESLDTTGLTLIVTYSDGSTETIAEGFTVCIPNCSTAGENTVIVVYKGLTTTFTITVKLVGTCGENLTWLLDDNGTLTISGIGAMRDYDWRGAPWDEYSNSIKNTVVTDGVTTISDEAFNGCDNMTNIIIPDSIVSIGDYAFNGCSSLTSITIPDSVDNIGDRVFSYCKSLTSIAVPDSVISVGSSAFYGCYSLTDVYYGGTAEQWSAISIESYNEPLINANVICLGDFKFSGASLSLQHNLAINYKVDKALFEDVGYTDPYVVFEMNGVKTTVSDYSVSEDQYVFTFRNIAPNQMNDTIYATLYATYDSVEYASAVREYSVAEYCYSMLSKSAEDKYAELRTLLVDLLNYGAASQTYTGYRTDALVNASLTAAQLQWATNEDPALDTVLNTTYETVENPTAKWKGAGLYLQEAVAMRLKFTAESIDGLTVKIESGENSWTISSDKFLEEDGVYYVYFSGLDAGQMRQNVYLTICDGDTPVSNTVCYSIESYACEKQNSTIDGLPELVKAMLKYGDSAYAYVN